MSRWATGHDSLRRFCALLSVIPAASEMTPLEDAKIQVLSVWIYYYPLAANSVKRGRLVYSHTRRRTPGASPCCTCRSDGRESPYPGFFGFGQPGVQQDPGGCPRACTWLGF